MSNPFQNTHIRRLIKREEALGESYTPPSVPSSACQSRVDASHEQTSTNRHDTNRNDSNPFQEFLAPNDKSKKGPNRISIEDIVDTRVISQQGFFSLPSSLSSPPNTALTSVQPPLNPSLTQVQLVIDSLQMEIEALKQRQQVTDEKIRHNPSHSTYVKLHSRINALDMKLSQYIQDQSQNQVGLQTSIQEKWKEESTHTWSIQRNELQSQFQDQLLESIQQEKLQRQADMQALHEQINHHLRQEFQEIYPLIDAKISSCSNDWKEMELKIQQQNQQWLHQWHTQSVSELKSWWEQETLTIIHKIHTQIQEEQNALKQNWIQQQQSSILTNDVLLQYQNNLMHKMEDKLHTHLQQISQQYQSLENTWKKKLEYMNDRCSLLEKHLLHNQHSSPTMNTPKGPQSDKNNIHTSTKMNNHSTASPSSFSSSYNVPTNVNLDTTIPQQGTIKVEFHDHPPHTSVPETFTCLSSDDEVETIKVVCPPQPTFIPETSSSFFTVPIQYPPENNKRTKKKINTSTKEIPSTTSTTNSIGKETNNHDTHFFNNTSWYHEPPNKKRTLTKETVKNSHVFVGSSSSSSKDSSSFNFHLNKKSAMEEQERLLRESADRVRAQQQQQQQQQQQETRKKKETATATRIDMEENNYAYVEPVDDLTKLPINHWKFTDMYARLGLPPKASDELIKKHYRKLCLVYHPDKNLLNGDDSQINADRFQGIKEAYECLMPK